MKIKASYFEKSVFPQLMKDVDAACKPFEKEFREELFDKLYDFFQHYFSESGSIYFRNTAQHHNIYEKVYTDDCDVMLFWKTQMMYYVKTDRALQQHGRRNGWRQILLRCFSHGTKRSNEKRGARLIPSNPSKMAKLNLTVGYSEKGRKTKTDEIISAIKAKGMSLDEDTLEKL